MRARWITVAAVAATVVGTVAGVMPARPAAADTACAPPRVSVAGAEQYEGSDGGTKVFGFAVTLTPSAAGCPAAGSVRYRTVGGTAQAGSDFVATTSTVTWTSAHPQAIPVQIVRDDAYEPDEQFTVELSEPRGVTIVDGLALGNVLNDDGGGVVPPGVRAAVIDGGICWFPDGGCRVTVTLNVRPRAAVNLRLHTVDGTALAGTDYVPIKTMPVAFPVGVDRVDVPVELIGSGDPAGKHFGVVISDVSAGTIAVPRTTVTIRRS